MKTSFAIIAAKNEAKNISKVVVDTRNYVTEVIVVDDGSSDDTAKIARSAGAIVLKHVINLGKGAAIRTGCDYALRKKADIVILLDADGQHEPKEIPKFLEKLENADVVIGFRTQRKSMPLILNLGNNIISSFTYFLYHIDIKDTLSGYRAFWMKNYNKIKWQSSGYSLESEMIANIGRARLNLCQIPISTIYHDRYKGTTILDGVKIVFDMIWWKISR